MRPSRGRLLLLCLTALFFAGAGYDGNVQEVAASRSGFTPAAIHARKGETLHLRLISRDQEHCFALDAFRVEKRIVAGRATTADVTPDRAGTFPYYCCLDGDHKGEKPGEMIVSE